MKRGLLPFDPASVPLKFGSYLSQIALPTPPRVFGHVMYAQPPKPWGMLGNDTLGDCVLAGAAHEQIVWSWATNKPIPSFSAQGITDQYMKLTGGKDTGLDMVEAAQWRRGTGITDDSGGTHKIDAFTEIRSPYEIAIAAFLFGTCGVGFALPYSAEQQFKDDEPWSDTSGDPKAGHYVPCVGRNSRGMLMFVSWGRLQAATDEWIAKYFMGALAYMSRDYMVGDAVSPESISWDQLAADLDAL